VLPHSIGHAVGYADQWREWTVFTSCVPRLKAQCGILRCRVEKLTVVMTMPSAARPTKKPPEWGMSISHMAGITFFTVSKIFTICLLYSSL
jgi:hypothetical protein